jgi:hypothetical protein
MLPSFEIQRMTGGAGLCQFPGIENVPLPNRYDESAADYIVCFGAYSSYVVRLRYAGH